jgi:hypothetical protein
MFKCEKKIYILKRKRAYACENQNIAPPILLYPLILDRCCSHQRQPRRRRGDVRCTRAFFTRAHAIVAGNDNKYTYIVHTCTVNGWVYLLIVVTVCVVLKWRSAG